MKNLRNHSLDQFAHSLAYEFCASLIQDNATHVLYDDDPRDWYDLADLGTATELDEVRYLEARGMLIRHRDNRKIVTILDEDA